jgi:hypothetical protein
MMNNPPTKLAWEEENPSDYRFDITANRQLRRRLMMDAERASIEAILEENELHRHDTAYIMDAYDKLAATNAALLEALEDTRSFLGILDIESLDASEDTWILLTELLAKTDEAIRKATG